MENAKLLKTAKTWKKGEKARYKDGAYHPIDPGLFWHEGFGVGIQYLSGGRAVRCFRTEGQALCKESGDNFHRVDCYTGCEK